MPMGSLSPILLEDPGDEEATFPDLRLKPLKTARLRAEQI
jgi:hypothetical protein